MIHELRLPDIGEGVAEGEIIRWLATEGQAVKEDQALVEVLTDKADVEIPSPVAGILSKIVSAPGTVVKVGEVLAHIDIAPAGLSILSDAASLRVSSAPGPKEPAAEAPPARTAVPRAVARPTRAAEGETLATPAVRRRAKEFGVDISLVKGTGPDGRVTEADVDEIVLSHLVEGRPVGRLRRTPVPGKRA